MFLISSLKVPFLIASKFCFSFSSLSRYKARYFGAVMTSFLNWLSVRFKFCFNPSRVCIPSSSTLTKLPFFRRKYFFFLSYFDRISMSSSFDMSSAFIVSSSKSPESDTPTSTLPLYTTWNRLSASETYTSPSAWKRGIPSTKSSYILSSSPEITMAFSFSSKALQ